VSPGTPRALDSGPAGGRSLDALKRWVEERTPAVRSGSEAVTERQQPLRTTLPNPRMNTASPRRLDPSIGEQHPDENDQVTRAAARGEMSEADFREWVAARCG
jgi:hypothetical protein